MEPEAHFIVAETDEAERTRPHRRIRMDAAFWPTFALLLVAMTLTVAGELLLKNGMNLHGELNVSMDTILPTAVKVFTNPFVIGGFALIFSGGLFWLAVLSRWDLAFAYPLLSIGYIIGMLAAAVFLGERVTLTRILGVIVIVLGVYLITRDANH